MDITSHIKKIGKTRAEICAAAGISTAYLCMLESGERQVGTGKVASLAAALEVKPQALRPDLAALFSDGNAA